MSKPNYRVVLSFDRERNLFVARAPELEHCAGEGAHRGEAIARLEEEIDAQLANMLAHGTTPPRSVDEDEWTGDVKAHVSKTLHRELSYQARSEGLELDHLVAEILAAGLEARKQGGRGPRTGNQRSDNHGNQHPGGGGGRGGRGVSTQFLDDRANFIEYVRTLDNGNGPTQRYGGGGGGGGGRHDNRGGGGGGGGGRGGRRGGGGPRNDARGGGGGGGHQPPQHARDHAPQGGGNGNPGARPQDAGDRPDRNTPDE